MGVNLHNLADVRAGLGYPDEAEALYGRALAAKSRLLGPNHPQVGLTLNNLVVLVADRGDLARAAELADRAQMVLAAAVATDHPALVAANTTLAAISATRRG
ncbi:tetratricopeptide repeat protein [Micromonospora sp. ATCC 39149]|uniref:Tetratricopeptide repeat protein n=1 Tax=Micromonospora carbonacea TaxID=47853 RepID=A0A7D6CG60_9ACTN|nr:tetratricopeptide repeat protein [Micromonospora sp. ATCC 39149]QLK00694.1 tetratricopeptide repeat protein [Micromonospora carbonacea]